MICVRYPKEGSKRIGKYIEDLSDAHTEIIKSLPRSLPGTPLFRHTKGVSGIAAGAPFDPTYFMKWWNRACKDWGIEGVGLYGGTKHSTTTALSAMLTPEEIKRGGTQHATNAVFE